MSIVDSEHSRNYVVTYKELIFTFSVFVVILFVLYPKDLLKEQILSEKSNYDLSMLYLKNLLEHEPENESLMLILAEQSLRSGKRDLSLRLLNLLLKSKNTEYRHKATLLSYELKKDNYYYFKDADKQAQAKEELRRVEAIYEIVAKEELYKKVKFSCDSYEPIVIQRALESGFSIVNDITGLENDEVCKLCAEYNATAIIMHMQGSPQTMQNNPIYEDMLYDVYSFLEQRVQKAESFGVKDIILDVGIGFGKTLDDNLKLINYLDNFLLLGKSLLVGASRKSMIDTISPSSVQERLGGTIAIHLEAIRNGASIVRVHDVKEHSQAIKIHEALKHNTADHKE